MGITFAGRQSSSGRGRAHGVAVAYGDEGEVYLEEVADDFHIAEEAGVAGMVDAFAIHVDDKTYLVAGGAGVLGIDHVDVNAVAGHHRAADIHAFCLEAIGFCKQGSELVGHIDRCAGLFADFNRVADVVWVVVSYKHNITLLDICGRDGCGGISCQEGVNHNYAGAFQEEPAVAEPRNFHFFSSVFFVLSLSRMVLVALSVPIETSMWCFWFSKTIIPRPRVLPDSCTIR